MAAQGQEAFILPRPSTTDFHQLLETEASKAGFSLTSLIDDDARAYIADTVIENYRSSGHASKAVMFGFCLISWIENTLIDVDFDAHLSIGAIARLVAYAAYTIDDTISFQRATRLMQRSIKITGNNWLRGGYLHNVRRALADSTNPLDRPSRLRRTAELALEAAALGRFTEVNHPAARYWEPSYFLTAVAMLSSRAAVDGVDESEIETVRMILDGLNAPNQQIDFKLIAALNIAEIRTQADMVDKAALEVSSAITELDKHLHTYFGLRAFARRIQGDIALINSVSAGKGEKDERLLSSQALYIDAGYMYSRYGNSSMQYKLDKRVQLATDLMQVRTARPATGAILRHPSFRLRIA